MANLGSLSEHQQSPTSAGVDKTISVTAPRSRSALPRSRVTVTPYPYCVINIGSFHLLLGNMDTETGGV
jgi:hypothetical protein